MWFRTKYEIYFLLTYKELKNKKTLALPPATPKPAVSLCSFREIKPTDKLHHVFKVTEDGVLQSWEYKYLVEGEPETATIVDMKYYPDHPDYLNLPQFISKVQPGAHKIELSDFLLLYQDGHTMSLTCAGSHILAWDTRGVTFFNGVNAIDYYKLYGDKSFEYQNANHYWEVRSPRSKWIPIFHGLQFNRDLIPMNEHIGQRHLEAYQRAVKTIDDYLDSITIDTVNKTVGNSPSGSAVATRCGGCLVGQRHHFTIHMQRKELPFYMIFSAVGECSDLDPLPETWRVIQACKDEKGLGAFKVTLKSFLESAVIRSELQLDLSTNTKKWEGFTSNFKPSIFKTSPFKKKKGLWENTTAPSPTAEPTPSDTFTTLAFQAYQASTSIQIESIQIEQIEPELPMQVGGPIHHDWDNTTTLDDDDLEPGEDE